MKSPRLSNSLIIHLSNLKVFKVKRLNRYSSSCHRSRDKGVMSRSREGCHISVMSKIPSADSVAAVTLTAFVVAGESVVAGTTRVDA